MHLFFEEAKNKKVEYLSYILFYLLIVFVYLVVNIPIFTLVCNIFGFFLISLNYNASLKKRLLSIFIIYAILITTELIVALISGYLVNSIYSTSEYATESAHIIVQLLNYSILRILRNYNSMKNGYKITLTNWIIIILIPICSICVIILLISSKDLTRIQVILSLVCMLVINFSTFFLYENISKSYLEKIDKLVLSKQNEYYLYQLERIETAVANTNSFKHDLKNHLSAITSFLERKNYDLALEYISKLTRDFYNLEKYVNTGNIDIDSILNFKINEVKNKNIELDFKIIVPEKISISAYDSMIILGNLFDNAINAVSSLPESQRKIKFKMVYDKKSLIIFSANRFNDPSNILDAKELLFNKHKIEHGLGLKNVEHCIKKYMGSMDIVRNESHFEIKILMYL